MPAKAPRKAAKAAEPASSEPRTSEDTPEPPAPHTANPTSRALPALTDGHPTGTLPGFVHTADCRCVVCVRSRLD